MTKKRLLVQVPGRALVLSVTGFALCWVAFYPGYMSFDSLYQYAMSNSGSYSDWHPPLMAWFWSVLNLGFDGPQGMLFWHLALLWGGLYAWSRIFRGLQHHCLIPLVGFLPWVLNFSGVLWKDVGMAFGLLGMMAAGLSRPSRWSVAVAAVLLFYAVNVRHNAIFAALPLLLLIARNWFPRTAAWKSGLLAVGALAVTLWVGNLFTYHWLDAKREHPSDYMMLDDLVHLSLTKGESLVPGVRLSAIQECAVVDVGQTPLLGRTFCLDRESQLSLKNALGDGNLQPYWRAAVAGQPLAYVRFRLAAFAHLLRSPDSPPYYVWQNGIDRNDQGLQSRDTFVNEAVEVYVRVVAHSAPFLFKPYFWLCLGGVLLLYSLWVPPSAARRASQALLASGVFYVLGYLPATPLADFRYVYWSVIATSLAAALLMHGSPAWRARGPGMLAAGGAMAIALIALVPRLEAMLAIDTHALLERSLSEDEAYVAAGPIGASDLRREATGPWYSVIGPDPWLSFDLSGRDPGARSIAYLSFDFACERTGAQQPRLQLFVWSAEQGGPAEGRSLFTEVKKGRNMVALGRVEWLKGTEGPAVGLRIDLDTPQACGKMRLDGVRIY